jgi:hypothetical protein
MKALITGHSEAIRSAKAIEVANSIKDILNYTIFLTRIQWIESPKIATTLSLGLI